MRGLPIQCYTKEVERNVVGRFGDFSEIDIMERTEEEVGSFFCIQAKINGARPLRNGIRLIASIYVAMLGDSNMNAYPISVSFVGKLDILLNNARKH